MKIPQDSDYWNGSQSMSRGISYCRGSSSVDLERDAHIEPGRFVIAFSAFQIVMTPVYSSLGFCKPETTPVLSCLPYRIVLMWDSVSATPRALDARSCNGVHRNKAVHGNNANRQNHNLSL